MPTNEDRARALVAEWRGGGGLGNLPGAADAVTALLDDVARQAAEEMRERCAAAVESMPVHTPGERAMRYDAAAHVRAATPAWDYDGGRPIDPDSSRWMGHVIGATNDVDVRDLRAELARVTEERDRLRAEAAERAATEPGTLCPHEGIRIQAMQPGDECPASRRGSTPP
jgi:hypothetical protein